MSSNFQKTTSNFFVTVLIGLIVVSFMFTGYESMKGAPNAVAKVGSYPITGREYQMEYNRQVNFFQNALMGGKTLTSQDIERFGIKEAALKNLVQSKLQLMLADKLGVVAAPEEVKQTIKDFDFFQTNGQFDITKYKGLLQANGLTPTDFEQDIINQVHRESTDTFLGTLPLSDKFVNEIGRFKSMKYDANVAEISEGNLRNLIPVTGDEVKTYLENEANMARTENIFKERKAKLDIPEKVQASHILISTRGKTPEEAEKKINEIAKEVTPSNFKNLANKYTEDPSGKNKGGSLGLFGKGRMVPEFENVAFTLKPGTVSEPVKTNFGYHLIFVEKKVAGKEATLEEHKNTIATELIRQNKNEELKELLKEVTTKVSAALKANDEVKLKALKAQYGFTLDENTRFNRYEGSLGQIMIPSEQMKEIWAGLKTSDEQFMNFSLTGKNLIVSIKKAQAKNGEKDEAKFDPEKEKKGLQTALSNKLKQEVMKQIGNTVDVKRFVEL